MAVTPITISKEDAKRPCSAGFNERQVGSEPGEFDDVHERLIGIGNNISKGKGIAWH
jgi:hypothetical protein